jgi:hypothetical protein
MLYIWFEKESQPIIIKKMRFKIHKKSKEKINNPEASFGVF